MCTLWQRFGRAARDQKLEGTAIFFVEPKYFDSERQKREVNAKKRKRKGENYQKTKRVAGNPTNDTTQPVPIQIHLDGPDEEEDSEGLENGIDQDLELQLPNDAADDNDDARRAVYSTRKHKVSPLTVIKAHQKFQLEPAMDDMINAGNRGLGCRRKPLKLFFNNDRVCMCLSSYVPLFAHSLRHQLRTTLNATNRFLLAAQGVTYRNLYFAAICVTPTLLNEIL